MSEATPSVEQPNVKRRFNVLSWLGLLIGIIGLATGYLYYLWTITYPEVTWWSTDQLVFNSQNANPDIRVLDRSGAQIEHNVYAANISVSNTGKALLEHTNEVGSLVRSPLVITLTHSTDAMEHVLGASIVDVSEQSPVKLTCQRSASGVSLTWDHFDPGSGFRILLLYTASQQLPPDVNISVVGMRRPNHIELTQRMTEIPAAPKVDPLFQFLATIVGVTLGLFVFVVVIGTLEKKTNLLGLWHLVEMVREKVMPFYKRNSAVFDKLFTFVGHAIVYGWIASVCVAVPVLAIYYQSTLLDIWHYEFPSTQPPLAIGVPVTNMPCDAQEPGANK